MRLSEIKIIIRQARKHYSNRDLQRQLVRKTVWLIERGIYALHLPQGKKYPSGRNA